MGRLNTNDFKSCLRALGYDLPMVEEGQTDPEFEAIMDIVDPNRFVSNKLWFYFCWMFIIPYCINALG